MSTRERVAALMPLASRLSWAHVWKKTSDGPRHIEGGFSEFRLAEHASGRMAYGLCPIAPGESTCRVALLDLDSHRGEVPFEQMLDTARGIAFALEQDGYAPILWRSSGGAGIHLYLLFDELQDAFSVRAMLSEVIALLGFTCGTGGVAAGQIEIFPKQDSVPVDGCGSMFILAGAGKSERL